MTKYTKKNYDKNDKNINSIPLAYPHTVSLRRAQ